MNKRLFNLTPLLLFATIFVAKADKPLTAYVNLFLGTREFVVAKEPVVNTTM